MPAPRGQRPHTADPPPSFSRRHRRWVHHQKVMRCFTDEEIVQGLIAVLSARAAEQLRGQSPDDNALAVFLKAAQPNAVDITTVPAGVTPVNLQPSQTWPFPHPMHCPKCDRAITDATGRSLVKIVIEDSVWTCATCP